MGALFKIFKSDGVTEITNTKSVTYREAVNTGEYLKPGCVSSAAIDVEVFNTQPNAVAAGDVVLAYVVDNNDNATLLGRFICEPKIDTKNSYKFSAYDNALKLNADFSQWLQANQSSFPMTVNQLVQQACTIAGVTLGTATWPLSTQNVQAFYADGLTCRDILSYAAELSGKFVRCHTDGKVYIEWYTYNANSIAPSSGTGIYAYKQDGLTYANYTTTALARVAVHPSGEDDVAYVYPTDRPSGNTLHIKNNLLLTGADASFYNAVAQQVYFAIRPISQYSPMSVSLFPRENPFRAGDIVSITDAQGVTISAPIMGITISNANVTLLSDGRETYEDNTEIAKAITQLASDIVRINKLKVSWAEINQAIINYLTANDVVAQNLTIVDANDVVLATFNANGITIGQTSEGHMVVDYNSFELYDNNGNIYTSIGDMRDQNGYATLTETTNPDPNDTTVVTLNFNISSVDSVTVNGTPSNDYTISGNTLVFNNALVFNDEVVVQYKTTSAVYHYDLGKRASGTPIGAWSVANGSDARSSGSYSTVSGGKQNTAIGWGATVSGGVKGNATSNYATVGGGYTNSALGSSSTIGGGYNNVASGTNGTISGGRDNSAYKYGAIGGGSSNTASGDWGTISGGYGNTASGETSAIGGGRDNTASGYGSFAANRGNEAGGYCASSIGRGNKASGDYQLAYGKYCVEDSNGDYAEIVGNGADDNNRSNARTLDWSGNEVLAGGLTQGGIYVADANIIPPVGTMAVYRYDINSLNTAYTTGVSSWSTGVIFAFSTAANNCGQLAITSGANVMYYRRCYSGTWTAWAKVYDTLSPPTASDVGLGNVDNVQQYSANNPPPYPVTSVNGQTGGVSLNASNVGAVDKTGDTMTGNLTFNGGWVIRNLPSAMSNGTNYYVARFTNSDSTIRGGLAAYNSSINGKGIRLVITQNGLSNGIELYFDANDNPSVVLGQPAAWRSALGVSADYVAGDTISFPSTGNSYYQRFHGDWRYSYALYFFIPLARSCEGLTATASGTVYVVTNKTRTQVNLSGVAAVDCFCAPGGVAVRLNWGSGNAPSLGQSQYDIASVQPYGMTITFS